MSVGVEKARKDHLNRVNDLYNVQEYFVKSCFVNENRYSALMNLENTSLQAYLSDYGFIDIPGTEDGSPSSNMVTSIDTQETTQVNVSNNTYSTTVVNNITNNDTSMAITFEGVVGDQPIIDGTDNLSTGFSNGSSIIVLADWINRRVYVERGGQRLPQIDGGFDFCTKSLSSSMISFNTPLAIGELIYIHTI